MAHIYDIPKGKRFDPLTLIDLPLICLEASIEINNQIQEGEVNYSPVNELSEILTNEAGSGRMSFDGIAILGRVFSEHYDEKETRYVHDLTRKTALLASELKSIRNLPKDKLEQLKSICLGIAKESGRWKARYTEYRRGLAYI